MRLCHQDATPVPSLIPDLSTQSARRGINISGDIRATCAKKSVRRSERPNSYRANSSSRLANGGYFLVRFGRVNRLAQVSQLALDFVSKSFDRVRVVTVQTAGRKSAKA